MRVSSETKYILLTIWLTSLLVVPLLIFARGLLLHRDALTKKSFCQNDSFSTCLASETNIEPSKCLQYYNSSDEGQYCMPSKHKMILILIDALRFDFVEHQANEDERSIPYHNKLKSITELLATRPENTRLFRFIADPPTATMQRIKGLTTGSLPTFIDIGSNFASAEIDEDNIVDAMSAAGKRAVFLGDDTWTKLYPNRFIRSFPFDSFNVWDLDTVDRGIKQHFVTEIRKTDWDLIIAHFLGVDHCGHRYGPNHPEMMRKLLEMDFTIREVVNEIRAREDVILFVIGDHGMTASGDHGGETENEVTAAWFAYSPVQPFFGNLRRSSQSVSQVDIVPTLATILGVSVPFSNTGRVVLECIPNTILRPLGRAMFILWQNIEQITKYVHEYSSQNTQFDESSKKKILGPYDTLKNRWYNIESMDAYREFVHEYDSFMEDILKMCRLVWIQFNTSLITIGIAFMFIAVVLCAVVVNETKAELPVDFNLVSCAVAMFLISYLILPLYTALIVFQVVSMICLFRGLFPRKLNVKNLEPVHVFVLFCKICLAGAFFSNSFILEEPSVVIFFLMSSLWITFLRYGKRLINVNFILANVAYKIGFYGVVCREEQPHCRESLLEQNYNAKYPFIAAIVFVAITIQWSKETGLNQSTYLAFVSKACMLCVVVFWMKASPVGGFLEHFAFVDNFPGLVFGICGMTFCILVYNPVLCNGTFEISRRSRIAWANLLLILCIAFSVLLDSSVSVSSVLMLLCSSQLGTFLSSVPSVISWSPLMVWSMSAVYWFYATGHYASFSSIQWNAAFLFQKNIGNNTFVPGLLVTMNTFAAYIVHGLLLPFLCKPNEQIRLQERYDEKALRERYRLRSTAVCLKYITIFAFRLLAMMTACAIHSRHLMMWQIFAPKLIFEALAFLITVLSSFIGLIFSFRICG